MQTESFKCAVRRRLGSCAQMRPPAEAEAAISDDGERCDAASMSPACRPCAAREPRSGNPPVTRAFAIALAVVLAVSGVTATPGEAHAAKKSATITVSQVQKHFNKKVGNRALGARFHHYCLAFVSTMWASRLNTEFYSVCCARKYGSMRRMSSSMNNIPIGADVFFTGSGTHCSSCGRQAGHVGVYVGDGYMVHSSGGRIRRDKVVTVASVGNLRYYGWGYHEGVKVKPDKGKHPRGKVQDVEGGAGSVTVSGWALDESNAKKSVQLKVWIGAPSAGGELHVIRANKPSAKLNKKLKVKGKHRFETTITTKLTGRRTLYFYAVNIGAGNDKLIGKKTVTIKKAPPKLARPAVKSLKSGKRTLRVTWKAASVASGYEVRWSTDKSFKASNANATGKKRATEEKDAKAEKAEEVAAEGAEPGSSSEPESAAAPDTTPQGSKIVTKAKKVKGAKATTLRITGCEPDTKYYVQVRTYKKQEGEAYYSKWSKAKVIRTKK